MGFLLINLRDALLAENAVVQRHFVSERQRRMRRTSELAKLKFDQHDLQRMEWPAGTDLEEALRILGLKDSVRENVAEDRLPADRTVHFEAIRRICVNYGLVFRPFRDYRGPLAKEVAIEVLKLKSLLGRDPEPGRFFIAAPKELFCDSLKPIDPFLFYEIGPDEYYLVHQWGLDTSPLRLVMHWPRGTRHRLLATRSVFCVAVIAAMQWAAVEWVYLESWIPLAVGAVLCCWLRFLWIFRNRRRAQERRWFQP